MERIQALLKEFGLTDYETKAYVTLLKLKTSTADQISKIGSIPLPRVYDTLVELQKKGFVLISKSRPKKFKPVVPEKALSNLINIKKNNFESNLKYLENNIKKVNDTLSELASVETPKEEVFAIWSTEKRVNIVTILDEQKKMAKKEILIFSGDMSWIREAMSIVKQAIKNGVKIRAIVHEPQNETWLKNIKLAKKLGIDVKTNYKGFMRGHIIDDKTVSIAVKRSPKGLNVAGDGKPGSDTLNQYELITSDNPILVKTMKENFDFWWKNLK